MGNKQAYPITSIKKKEMANQKQFERNKAIPQYTPLSKIHIKTIIPLIQVSLKENRQLPPINLNKTNETS